jgi:conjugal transfer ATP-binding protein TraC
LCKILKGVFVNFSKSSGIVLNPFSHVVDINDDGPVIAAIVGQMVYSGSNKVPDETEKSIIKNAVRYAYENYGPEANIDSVYEYLTGFRKYADELLDIQCEENDECAADLTITA